jgi:hypothetical protein
MTVPCCHPDRGELASEAEGSLLGIATTRDPSIALASSLHSG